MKELIDIQKRLKAPKGQFNSFGGYKYRSCEDILEAVKPLLHENGCTMTLSDTLVNFADRFYVMATATIRNSAGESVEAHAYAREALTKKGMDDSQITGTASSYARKYALNGLFLIDDTKDADTDAYVKQTNRKEAPKEDLTAVAPDLDAIAPDRELAKLQGLCTQYGIDIKEIGKSVGAKSLKTMTNAQVGKAMEILRAYGN